MYQFQTNTLAYLVDLSAFSFNRVLKCDVIKMKFLKLIEKSNLGPSSIKEMKAATNRGNIHAANRFTGNTSKKSR